MSEPSDITQDTLLVTPEEVSALLRGKVKVSTLAKWRREGKGPPFIYAGGSVLYPKKSFEEWIENNTSLETCAPGR